MGDSHAYNSNFIKKRVYAGPFVQCRTLTDLDICNEGIIGVDQRGRIEFIERGSSDVEGVTQKHDWRDFDVVRIKDNGFFFPGFIGIKQC